MVIDSSHFSKISGGNFSIHWTRPQGDYAKYAALQVTNHAEIDEISGGTFTSETSGSAYIYGHVKEISGGTFRVTNGSNDTRKASVRLEHITTNSKARIDIISGGVFDGNSNSGNASGFYLKDIVGHSASIGEIKGGTFEGSNAGITLCTRTKIEKITGGNFVGNKAGIENRGEITAINNAEVSGADAIQNNAGTIDDIVNGKFTGTINSIKNINSATIKNISGGSFVGEMNSIMNEAKINEITDGVFQGGQSGLLNNQSNWGVIGTINGGTFKGNDQGLLNSGTIESVENGKFIGDIDGAVNNGNGTIGKITNGVFLGKTQYAIDNTSDNSIQLEPGLTTDIGLGRYKGSSDGKELNDVNKFIIPDGYSMSGPDETANVAGLGDGFHFLKRQINNNPNRPILYTVTFHPENGQNIFRQNVEPGHKAVRPSDPVKEGYTFTGWYTDKECTKLYDFNTPVYDNIELYAGWKEAEKKPEIKPGVKEKGILLPKVVATGKHNQKLTWTKLNDVDGYIVYMNKCNSNGKLYSPKKVATVKAGKKRVYYAKKLSTGSPYKYFVSAYKIKNGKRVIVKNSLTAHSIAGNTNSKFTNVRKTTVKKSRYTLKLGKKATIKPRVYGFNRYRRILSQNHAEMYRYVSDSSAVKVSSNGVITARRKGSAKIYVLGSNGVRTTVKVTVK